MQTMLGLVSLLSQLFVMLIGIGALAVVVLYFIDRFQTAHSLRRNFPVLARFRYLFESLGEFFRQYFFAMDREELPFNRADRTWIYQAAKRSTRLLTLALPETFVLRARCYSLIVLIQR